MDAPVPAERAVPLVHFGTDPFIICEIKRRSPSRGAIDSHLDPIAQAGQYVDRGIGAISVLTEQDHFSGSLEDLMAVKRAYPHAAVLRKDFLLAPEDIVVSYRAGADAVLLIASVLEKERIRELYERAVALGMSPLVEVHDRADIDKVRDLQPACTGINARDLKTFRVDLTGPVRLQSRIDWETKLVFESGIGSEEDAAFAAASGFAGILVGEAVVKQPDLTGELLRGFTSQRINAGDAVNTHGAARADNGVTGDDSGRSGSSFFWRRLYMDGKKTGPYVKICGLTRPDDVAIASELGADILGFIFADSPRRVDGRLLRDLPADLPLKSAVVVTGADIGAALPLEVGELLEHGLIDVVQFHGDESPGDCYKTAFPYYKALRLKGPADIERIDEFRCPRVLVDAYSKKAYGGTGKMIDPDLVCASAEVKPLWLAGGIGPENVANVLEMYMPELIDVSSGLESSPGVKDHSRMKRLFSEIEQWRDIRGEDVQGDVREGV